MDIPQALIIVRKLANGVHPYKGTELPASSVCQHPDTVRALVLAIDALNQFQRFEARQENGPPRASMAWSDNEKKHLIKAFRSGKSLTQIAKEHQRTDGAIRSRLIKLGLINE